MTDHPGQPPAPPTYAEIVAQAAAAIEAVPLEERGGPRPAERAARAVLDLLLANRMLYQHADPWMTNDGAITVHWPPNIHSALISREMVDAWTTEINTLRTALTTRDRP